MKRLALENERAVVLQMAFRAQNVFGTFEERASKHISRSQEHTSTNKRHFNLFIKASPKYSKLEVSIKINYHCNKK